MPLATHGAMWPERRIVTIKEKLEIGKIYTFIRPRCGHDGNNVPIMRKERWRLVAKYKYHAQFENQFGYKQSFQYWDIEKLLKGEKIY